MECPRCKTQMKIYEDYTCEDAYDCNCGDGLVTEYACIECQVKVTLVTDCKDNVEED